MMKSHYLFQVFLLLTSHVVSAYEVRRKPDRIGAVSERGYKRLEDHEDAPPLAVEQQQQQQRPSAPPFLVESVSELWSVILDQNKPLNQVEIRDYARKQTEDSLLTHDVLELMSKRFQENSKPGARNDDAKLALAMEGGGMRGAVSAGMAAALAALGLTDTIDVIYGSSAGSVIGAYMVSQQMCLDVYVDILPAAKKKFVCKRRMIRSIFADLVNVLADSLQNTNKPAATTPLPKTLEAAPGMNISFILDGIMDADHGIRPLDFEKFRENNEIQPLRVVASCIDSKDNMFSICFGTDNFFNATAAERRDGSRQGLFACLEASVTVPGATGPPVELKTSGHDEILPCFDAFCFEPLPYRSAVEEGATHVMVLCSRPEGYQPKTKQGAYEKGVAPWYFRSHGHANVAKFFEQGGQQYIYAEDMLLLEHGKSSLSKVLVPPPKVLYGAKPQIPKSQQSPQVREEDWKSAYLLPIKVPMGTPELENLEQDEDIVLEAVRGGFAVAFDMLAPIVGLEESSPAGLSQPIYRIGANGAGNQTPCSRRKHIGCLRVVAPPKKVIIIAPTRRRKQGVAES
jgi:predicted patatin/cPLA2 family phospholipase